ncbi:MAG: hypothetical protein JWP76_733 [Dactylosporangium sp.]|nr:hypothetical protein [Dactylosporangium sp.]
MCHSGEASATAAAREATDAVDGELHLTLPVARALVPLLPGQRPRRDDNPRP